jgi:hypothetical protein
MVLRNNDILRHYTVSQHRRPRLKIKLLPVVLYAHGAWSLTLSDEREFQNRVLRRIFGFKRE